jgi:hypothetical protein
VANEGQGKYRIVVGVPTPEEPTRLIGQLQRFTRCAIALGLDADEALNLAGTLAMDSVPLGRMRALRAIADTPDPGCTVTDVHRALIRGNRWAALYELDALEAIGLITVHGPSRDEDAKATRVYALADEYREVYESVTSFSIAPYKRSEGSYGFAHPNGTTQAANGQKPDLDDPPPYDDAEVQQLVTLYELDLEKDAA